MIREHRGLTMRLSGAPAATPQGGTPPDMQPAPGGSKSIVGR